ncbi:S1C family serine protease [Streptomyces sp. cf386]|uniref:S1C family serine protease n=1 Tax=Streptomyces sp. cf386 TaxID=1761904 RepID=UPI0015A12102|nr:trypsin-like peptidase domain-containing protein [Streptomyces sp. cf386]
MNEGKPAKAKWWNRPRPQEPSAQAEDTEPTPDGTSATAPGASDPTGPTAPGSTGERGLGDATDGDFEWARPAARTADDAASHEGDFELPRPAAGGSGGDVASAGTEGDFELAQPAARGGGVASAEAEGDFELARPGVGGSEGGVVSAEGDFELARPVVSGGVGDVASAEGPGPVDVPAEPTDARPKPLHDPDPYSTPPYGEPGPWAPAPPVQHPATTPAHGTAVPPPPPHATSAPPPGPPTPTHSAPTAAHGTPAPSAAPAPAGSVSAAPPSSAPGVAASAPVGVAVPPPSSAPSAPAPAPTAGVPAPAPPPAPGAPVPASAPGIPAQAAPPAADPLAQIPPAQPTPVSPAPLTTPWQNYDPWASNPHPGAPLQQNGAAVVTEQQRRKRGKKVILVGVLLIALVSGGVGGVVGAYLERNGGVGELELPQAGAESSGRAPDSVAGIAARALPSVVTLHVSGSEEQGTGTGFVLDDQGHILTNNHVVEPAGDDGEISVTFHSGDTAKATVVGRDGGYDLAVVKVSDVKGLTPLPLGNSDNVQVGDPVVAIGAPFDLAGTVTSGIISAKERPITAGGESGDGSDVSYVDALQTDAPINPGNSGGPLLDARARVIGINSAIRSADSGSDLDGGQSGSIGLGFAIPVNQAKRVAEELINTGGATHPVIGVTLDMDYTGDGARVGAKGGDGGPAVTEGGPGAKAGIKAGDVITEVDGQRVHSGEELIVKTRAHRPGDQLELTLERAGKEITISLTLGSSSGN